MKEDSLVQVMPVGSRCWPSEQHGSPFIFKGLLVQNDKENVFGALGFTHVGACCYLLGKALPVRKKQRHFSV